MYLTVKEQLKNLTKEEYLILRELTHTAKNLYNVALYNIRQHFFQTGEYLSYEKNDLLSKSNENYKILNSNMSQQILKEVDGVFNSFFELLKLKKKGKYNSKVNIPEYLKKDDFFTLIIGFVRLNGNRLKSINQWYNKQMAKYQSIKDKQKIKGITKRQAILTQKRNNQVNDYISKACRYIINYCIDNDIGTLVLGYNEDIQNKINIGKINNQNFVNIPIGNIKDKLDYLCNLYDTTYIRQEESYTSKASFFDKDEIPVIGDDAPEKFSGKRIKRGLYKTSTGYTLNADVNAALNILKKSRVVALRSLYSRGEVDTPKRIRIA